MTNYPNDPNQPGGYGEQPKDGSGDSSGNPQYGTPDYNSPQYGAPQEGSQYGAQPYGSPQYGTPDKQGNPYGAPVPQEHDKSTLIMILGILAIPCCGLFTGIPAIIMGRQALAQIDSSGGMLGGRGKVQAGFICGIIGTVLSVLGVIIRLAS
ncbi:hypothetical protein GCM10011492_06500 [Flexivirga endophytica]|uniref:DUF4190 domain-containing protein n=1 Tax=Flexivirga endophytica TaxID=1849103 RepID=A0A916SY04_9MICO|nr:DUF4190 domain-containing protein [Flexivirga endophytica]GGB19364.1 hypothetical protein GCM10011492_06500 [Flexivirga endophytica]GHB36341.1 hypothetical protein GCM10008112_01110 [Flexivirga endophytica]